MQKNLWVKESDKYTKRAQNYLKDNLYGGTDQANACKRFSRTINQYVNNPRNILDIGCAYGGLVYELMQTYNETNFFGIDPGKKSIEIANTNIKNKRVSFIQGVSDELPFKDCEFDIVILTMVLQWIPREKLIKTISEIDRVLRNGGLIYLEDYLTNQPVTSISKHNKEIRIFKDNYASFFSAFPWLREIYREVSKIKEGEDFQRNISVIRKYDLNDVYITKKGPSESNMIFSDSHK